MWYRAAVKIRQNVLKVRQLILLGLVLRVMVPVGLMPASPSDGWYLKLCPEGMSISSMVAMPEHGHHDHHGHGGDEEASFAQCDFAGFSSLAASGTSETSEFSILYNSPFKAAPAAGYDRDFTYSYRPRAPPLS